MKLNIFINYWFLSIFTMKKNLMFGFAALSMIALSACNEKEDAPVYNDDAQVFTVTVSNNDGKDTRAGRPLYSEAAAQNIDMVHFFIINTETNKVVYEKDIPNWMSDQSVITVGDDARQTTIELKGDDKLAVGTYKAYAVGYTSEGSVYTYDPDFTTLEKESDWISAVTATTSGDAEEIFAGTTEGNQNIVITSAGETFTKTIVLKRQVAGTYGYFTNIPAKGPKGEVAKTLRLVAAAKNKQVVLDGFEHTNAVNGKTSADEEPNVMFYDGKTKGFVVYSINLESWFTQGDKNTDGLLNADDEGWVAPISGEGEEDKVSFKTGSVFGGKFVVPFSAVESASNSLQLQLLDEGGNILRYWNVNLAAAQEDVIDITASEASAADEVSTSSYSVLRNHLYTLGMRKAGDNGGDDDPDGDEDNPEDLNKGQQLVIKVSGAWENITGMVLD